VTARTAKVLEVAGVLGRARGLPSGPILSGLSLTAPNRNTDVCAVSLTVNYPLSAYTRYEGHPDSSYPTRSHSKITTGKDWANSSEVIHLLTLMMQQLTNSGSRLAVKS
jgi:hypothetical protein